MRRTGYWKGSSLIYGLNSEGVEEGDRAAVAISKNCACFRVSPGTWLSLFFWRPVISGKLRQRTVLGYRFPGVCPSDIDGHLLGLWGKISSKLFQLAVSLSRL